MLTYSFVFEETTGCVILQERHFEGVGKAEYHDVYKFENINELNTTLEQLVKSIELKKNYDQAKNESRIKLLQNDIEAKQRELSSLLSKKLDNFQKIL